MFLRTHRDFATYARAMSRGMSRHVGVLLLDSRGSLVAYMFFPAPPDSRALIAAAYAAQVGRMTICFVRTGVTSPLNVESSLATRILDGASVLGINVEALVVTPTNHATVIHPGESGSVRKHGRLDGKL